MPFALPTARKLSALASSVAKQLSELLIPVRCSICLTPSPEPLCPSCTSRLHEYQDQSCIHCRASNPFGMTHQKCLTRYSPEICFSAYSYQTQGLNQAIVKGKYYGVKNIFPVFGKLLAENIEKNFGLEFLKGFWVTPIPLHPARYRFRGFNQTALLAQSLALDLGLSYVELLDREKKTKTQKDLKREQRLQNVKGCFTLKLPKDNLTGRKILLLDDVTTTGATFLEAVKTLKQANASKVFCLALARE